MSPRVAHPLKARIPPALETYPMSILTMSMPSGRTFVAPFKTISQAVRMVREFAASRGVSPLAIDWSVSRTVVRGA